jgi:hypothetical protein
MADLMAG